MSVPELEKDCPPEDSPPVNVPAYVLPGRYVFVDRYEDRSVTFTFQTLDEMRSFVDGWLKPGDDSTSGEGRG